MKINKYYMSNIVAECIDQSYFGCIGANEGSNLEGKIEIFFIVNFI